MELNVYPASYAASRPQRLRQDHAAVGDGRNPGPDCRRVRVLGTDLVLVPTPQGSVRRENVGFVFQQFNLLPALSAAENVCVPLLLAGWPRSKALRTASALLEKIGMGDRLRALPSNLSGGQQQRVAIARRWCTNRGCWSATSRPRPSTPQTGHTIMELLRGVALEGERAVIIVTHDSRIFDFGDRIAQMEDGCVTEIHSQQVDANRIASFAAPTRLLPAGGNH